MMRIGTGYDVHAFCKGDFVILGGIKIPFEKAFAAHSDGDVLIHAICDALLGALALGDIGQHFPPNDNKWKDCDSSVFLKHTMRLIKEQGYQINNIDSTIICEQPKMQPHIMVMRKNLANIMKLKINRVSVKATTTEKLGFCGRGEGIAVQSVCLLEKE
ncbi:MAG: 2-C-methyl-D-erythritol 2,4-cyclodiphosphate synthase [Proteobacteria bacterium]|nr:2-C-methyl-D-erythritol 2,4-cyclodiphosphate synthase [Pseudomonadota bacterium]